MDITDPRVRIKRPTAMTCHATRTRGIETNQYTPNGVWLGLYVFLSPERGLSACLFHFLTRLRLLKPLLPWLNERKSCRQRQTRARCAEGRQVHERAPQHELVLDGFAARDERKGDTAHDQPTPCSTRTHVAL